MRRLLSPLVLAAALFAATGCNLLGDDVAAVVEGRDIDIVDVSILAADPAWNPNGLPVDDIVLSGEPARNALSTLVQFALAEAELDRRGVTVTAEDRAAVEQAFAQNPQFLQLGEAVRSLFLEGSAAQAALDRVLAQIDPTDPAERRALYERTPSNHEQRCVGALVTDVGGGQAIVEALESGSSATDVLTEQQLPAQPAFPEPETCFSRDQLSGVPDEVLDLLYDTPIGEVAMVTVPAQATEVDVVIVVIEERTITPESDAMGELVAQVAQGGSQSWIPLVLPDAEVDVDPRFGEGMDAATGAIIPPPSPTPSLPPVTG